MAKTSEISFVSLTDYGFINLDNVTQIVDDVTWMEGHAVSCCKIYLVGGIVLYGVADLDGRVLQLPDTAPSSAKQLECALKHFSFRMDGYDASLLSAIVDERKNKKESKK